MQGGMKVCFVQSGDGFVERWTGGVSGGASDVGEEGELLRRKRGRWWLGRRGEVVESVVVALENRLKGFEGGFVYGAMGGKAVKTVRMNVFVETVDVALEFAEGFLGGIGCA